MIPLRKRIGVIVGALAWHSYFAIKEKSIFITVIKINLPDLIWTTRFN